MKIKSNNRGFAFGEFTDAKGVECSIQESSLAAESAIWFGVQDVDPKKLEGNVFVKVLPPNDIQIGGSFGDSVLFNTRMHLTEKHVEALIRDFEEFLTTGKCRTREFKDRYECNCSIRKTLNVETGDGYLELGCDDADPRICDRGWHSITYPEGTIFTTHMFLGINEIKDILPILERFVDTGQFKRGLSGQMRGNVHIDP